MCKTSLRQAVSEKSILFFPMASNHGLQSVVVLLQSREFMESSLFRLLPGKPDHIIHMEKPEKGLEKV